MPPDDVYVSHFVCFYLLVVRASDRDTATACLNLLLRWLFLQEAELRARPDIVVCTPGRMVDHLTNSASVHMDDVEILVLDEVRAIWTVDGTVGLLALACLVAMICVNVPTLVLVCTCSRFSPWRCCSMTFSLTHPLSLLSGVHVLYLFFAAWCRCWSRAIRQADRLLELGFQEEVAELVKSCPVGRQTLLFSATMNTKVDDLVSLALNKVGWEGRQRVGRGAVVGQEWKRLATS